MLFRSIDLGMKTSDDTNIYTGEADSHGAGDGGLAKRATLAWSTTLNTAQPYFRTAFTNHGSTTANGLKVENARELDVDTGVEVTTFSNTETGAWFALDLRTGFTYRSPAQVPSGVWLPSIMTSTENTLVTQSEYSTVSAGLGFRWQMFKYARLDVASDVGWVIPHQLESAYPVHTEIGRAHV